MKKKSDDQKRHTHSTINAIEDIEANAMNALSDAEILILRLRRLLGIAQDVRKGPHSYQRGSQRRPRKTVIEDKDGET